MICFFAQSGERELFFAQSSEGSSATPITGHDCGGGLMGRGGDLEVRGLGEVLHPLRRIRTG